jgi:hypothetical protein
MSSGKLTFRRRQVWPSSSQFASSSVAKPGRVNEKGAVRYVHIAYPAKYAN